jgi:hypothetical protein
MTIKKAYKKARKLPGRNYIVNCIETSDLWAFQFAEEPLEPGDFLIGGGYDCINKKTGELSCIPIPWGLDALEGGNKIDINTFKVQGFIAILRGVFNY